MIRRILSLFGFNQVWTTPPTPNPFSMAIPEVDLDLLNGDDNALHPPPPVPDVLTITLEARVSFVLDEDSALATALADETEITASFMKSTTQEGLAIEQHRSILLDDLNRLEARPDLLTGVFRDAPSDSALKLCSGVIVVRSDNVGHITFRGEHVVCVVTELACEVVYRNTRRSGLTPAQGIAYVNNILDVRKQEVSKDTSADQP